MNIKTEKQMINTTPKNIFDSRIARDHYVDLEYYRSEAFVVPAGYIAVVELTTYSEYMKYLMFTAVRMPASSAMCKDPDTRAFGKTYRRWRCSQSLGEGGLVNGQVSDYTEYNKSIVRWGYDNLREEIVEFEYIVRPGHYYLLGDRATNECYMDDCERPTLFDMTLIPVDNIPDLALPCRELDDGFEITPTPSV